MASVLLPFAFLALIEICCRFLDLGGYPPIIQEVGKYGTRHWYTTNRAGTDTFFQAQSTLTGGMRVVHFTTPKPAATVRIAILGGSAAQGFPQPLPLTNGSFLEAMLEDLWSDTRKVEVLNFGATAVASFPVMCILDEVLEHEPDLVVVMSGNNEFYGAYGVASLHPALRTPNGMRAIRWLRSLALTQALESLLSRASKPSGKLMEQMAGARVVAPDDAARHAAAKSLQSHLSTMARRCRKRNVPMIVCTIPTNERGMAPIGPDPEQRLSDEQRRAMARTMAEAEAILGSDPERAANLARTAIELDDERARAHFVLGSALRRLDRRAEALQEYRRARDLDTMPWRATSFARDAVAAAVAEGAIECDMESAFGAASPQAAIGWELLDDHVHMSVAGQALFATTILHAMVSIPGRLNVRAEELARLPDWHAYAERLGRSIYTDYVAASRIRSLFSIPFMKQNNEDAFHRFDKRCEDFLASMSDGDRRAVERWRDPTLHGATDLPLTFVVGVYRLETKDYASAERLFRTAQASVPTVSLWRLQLIWHILRCRRHLAEEPTPEDLELCREAVEIGETLNRYGRVNDPEVLRYLGLAYNLVGNHPEAVGCLEEAVRWVGGSEGWEVVAALVDSYLQTGRPAPARSLLQMALQVPETEEAARRLLAIVDQHRAP